MNGKTLKVGIGATVAGLTLLASGSSASAGMIEVTTKKVDGEGSLAAAIQRANKQPGGDQIRFDKRLRGVIDLPEEQTKLDGKVLIKGNGYGTPKGKSFRRLVLSGHRGGSALSVAGKGDLALRELYLDGVALRGKSGDLSVQDSYVDGSRTVDEIGVASGSKDGSLKILRTTVREFDLGVLIGGTGRIDESTIANNKGGGGVFVDRGTVDVSNSTISGNISSGSPDVVGGGLDIRGTARVVNSTIARNEAIGDRSRGGGIYGDAEVVNSTIAGNRAAFGAGIAGGNGDADVVNSIIYGNVDFGGTPTDCEQPFTSGGGNVIGTPGQCVLDSSDVNANPLLGALTDNGGLTQTMAIGAGSSAIGLAKVDNATKYDQRGFLRGSNPDSGAFQRKG